MDSALDTAQERKNRHHLKFYFVSKGGFLRKRYW